MEIWGVLREAFAYDRWANGLWLEWLEAREFPPAESAVMVHLLAAQRLWALRCRGVAPAGMSEERLDVATLDELLAIWQELLADRDDDPIIAFRRFNGDAYELTLSQVARHVANHGTYHRGEIRGLRRAADDADFPDTDLAIIYFRK